MNTLRCKTCEERGAPVEGMTGQCPRCHEVFCFGHLKNHSCQAPVALEGNPLVPHVANVVFPEPGKHSTLTVKAIGEGLVEKREGE